MRRIQYKQVVDFQKQCTSTSRVDSRVRRCMVTPQFILPSLGCAMRRHVCTIGGVARPSSLQEMITRSPSQVAVSAAS
jgi:hypothetical protein